ncbi:MAG: hypothetical protein IPM24_01450 [Bryobacterales bacterium]|nr:hypothetical protein [Bryobacterales bacterium]
MADWHAVTLAEVRARISGSLLEGNRLITWGDRITVRRLPSGTQIAEARVAAPLAAPGCWLDGLVALEPGGTLVRYRESGWEREVIATGIATRSLLATTLHGERGVLLVQKGTQLRFFAEDGWAGRDLYSFYHPQQDGLALAEVDEDEHPDLLCGDYWMRNPGSPNQPWHIHAIKIWHDAPLGAVTSFAWWRGRLAAAQSALEGAIVALYTKPADLTQPWEEQRLTATPGFSRPALRATPEALWIAEGGRPGRLFRYEGGELQLIARTGGIVGCHLRGDSAIVVERTALTRFDRSVAQTF